MPQMTGAEWVGVAIIALQAVIAILQYIIHQQNIALLKELRAMRPTIKEL